MDALSKFIPITKIDAAQRLVYGIATAEKLDRSKEICDYETTKPYYEKWSGDIAKTTDGKSLGNLRSMHGPVAAGKVTEITFNDDDKQIEICAKVVDDAEWNKVEEGVYTGFSQGGSYVKKWKDKEGLQRYTAEPVEISLVDVPCLPDATFQMVKADGTVELRKFATVVAPPSITAIGNRAEALAKAAGKTAWQDFADAANLELLTEAAAAAEAEQLARAATVVPAVPGSDADAPPAADPAAGAGASPAPGGASATPKPAKKWVEPKNIWACGHADHEHLTKAEAVKCMKDADALDKAHEAAAPVDAALTKLEAALGLETKPAATPSKETVDLNKKDYSEDDRKAMAKTGEALPDGSFPIKNAADLDNAVTAYGRSKNKAAAKRHIIKRAKALKLTDALPADWPGSTKKDDADKAAKPEDLAKVGKPDTPELKKSATLYSVSNLISLLASLESAEEQLESIVNPYAYYDYSPVTSTKIEVSKELCDRFGSVLVEFGDITASLLDELLQAMSDEESSEAAAKAAPFADLAKALLKAGARHSKTDLARLQKAHDLMVEMGAGCSDDEDAAKVAEGDDLSKALTENAALKAELASVTTRVDTVVKTVEQMGERLTAPKAATLVVTKGGDAGGTGQTDNADDFIKRLEGLEPAARNMELMKLALKFPQPGHPSLVVPAQAGA